MLTRYIVLPATYTHTFIHNFGLSHFVFTSRSRSIKSVIVCLSQELLDVLCESSSISGGAEHGDPVDVGWPEADGSTGGCSSSGLGADRDGWSGRTDRCGDKCVGTAEGDGRAERRQCWLLHQLQGRNCAMVIDIMRWTDPTCRCDSGILWKNYGSLILNEPAVVKLSKSLAMMTHEHTQHTHIRLMALCPGLPGWASTRKVKPMWILLKQETVSGSGISWAICKSASHSRQITMPAPHHSVFYRPDALPAAQPTVSNH